MLLLVLLWAAALIYQFLALGCSLRFFAQRLPTPAPPYPAVTLFKPLKGLEPYTRECLVSFLNQDYPPYQVLFGVGAADDPVVPLLNELKEAYPHLDMEVAVCPEKQGLNPKVSLLRQMEPKARHDLLVISDADVKVGPDFLSRVAAALQEPGVGLVSCPYRSGPGRTMGAWLEALSISADFIPSVTVATVVEEIRFALGATMALTRQAVERMGGLAPLADFLADDYQLGFRVAQSGLRVKVLPYVVETESPGMSLRQYLGHQLRWTRTYRVCRPGGYLAFGITHALIFSLALLLTSGGAAWAWGALAATLALRGALAWVSERLCLRGTLPGPAFFLLPIKDLVFFILWLLSFLGREVTWGKARFRLSRDGRLESI